MAQPDDRKGRLYTCPVTRLSALSTRLDGSIAIAPPAAAPADGGIQLDPVGVRDTHFV